jgi:hypothetical protein
MAKFSLDSHTTENLASINFKIKSAKRNTLAAWDLDDTLFHIPSDKLKIKVFNEVGNKAGNTIVYEMTTEEFGKGDLYIDKILEKHKGKLDENRSYSDFKSAEIFFKYAKPIQRNLRVAIDDTKNKEKFTIILTARSNLDDKEVFLRKLLRHGLDMNASHTHIIRTRSVTATSGANGKKEVVFDILKRNKNINRVEFWDDSQPNVSAIADLQRSFKTRNLLVQSTKV